jgi:hypothetical protein
VIHDERKSGLGAKDSGPMPGCDCAWCARLRAAFVRGFVAGVASTFLTLAVAFGLIVVPLLEAAP